MQYLLIVMLLGILGGCSPKYPCSEKYFQLQKVHLEKEVHEILEAECQRRLAEEQYAKLVKPRGLF